MDPAGAAADRPLSRRHVSVAWGVHLFTASGAVMGALALGAIARGHHSTAALWMLAAFAVDSVDGTLARRARVTEVLPGFDGRRLDDMVDYLNYVVVAAVFMAATGHLPGWLWTAVPILASAYGFSQVHAKTPDGFFRGWPSYWNVVALYLWLLGVSPWVGLAWVAGFAALIFIPLKYLYPSQMRLFRRATLLGAAVWMVVLALASLAPGSGWSRVLVWISLAFPAWYLGLSLYVGGWRRSVP